MARLFKKDSMPQKESGLEDIEEERAEILDALVGIKLNVIWVTYLTAAGDGEGDAVLDDSWADNTALTIAP